MQDLKVLATIVDEIGRLTRNLSTLLERKICVKVTRSRCVLSEDVEEKHYARFKGSSQ